jgi:hypothetical protein
MGPYSTRLGKCTVMGKPLSDKHPVVDPQTIHTRSVTWMIHLPIQLVINKVYDSVVKNDQSSILDFEPAVGDDGRPRTVSTQGLRTWRQSWQGFTDQSSSRCVSQPNTDHHYANSCAHLQYHQFNLWHFQMAPIAPLKWSEFHYVSAGSVKQRSQSILSLTSKQ